MPELAVVEQELGSSQSLQVQDPQKGSSEEADTIVARYLPEHRKVPSSLFKLSILLLYRYP